MSTELYSPRYNIWYAILAVSLSCLLINCIAPTKSFAATNNLPSPIGYSVYTSYPLALYEQVVVSYTEKYYWSDYPNQFLRGTTEITDIVYRNLSFPNGYNRTSSYTTRQDSTNHITYKYWTFNYSIY